MSTYINPVNNITSVQDIPNKSNNSLNEFKINDVVKVVGCPVYNKSDSSNLMNCVGRITKIRHRYIGTPNEYKQYKVSFVGIPEGDDVTNLFRDSDLVLASEKDIQSYILDENLQSLKDDNTTLQVGDFVRIIGPPCYSSYDLPDTLYKVGTISRIRHRYEGTPHEYKQYYVSFGFAFDFNSLNSLYSEEAVEKI